MVTLNRVCILSKGPWTRGNTCGNRRQVRISAGAIPQGGGLACRARRRAIFVYTFPADVKKVHKIFCLCRHFRSVTRSRKILWLYYSQKADFSLISIMDWIGNCDSYFVMASADTNCSPLSALSSISFLSSPIDSTPLFPFRWHRILDEL